jgi:succinate dehydrogenase / fumarate reductase cytochrome b subunit
MTQAAKPVNRPLSPHVFIYRWPLASLLSIGHRIMGVGLTIGTLLLTWWIASAAYGPSAYETATDFLGSPLGYLLLFGFSFALFFHLCNGIRHLLWDIGKNFEIAQTRRANVFVIAGTLALTAITWLLALSRMGEGG